MTTHEPRDDAPDLAPDDAIDPIERDRPPSRRFRILFAATMILIAVGYTWVWRVKTERVVAEPAPVLALAGAASYISDGNGDADGLETALAEQLARVPGLTVLRTGTRNPVEAGAAQVLHADLRPGGAGQVLELRRTDAKTGDALYVYRVEGRTLDEAVYRMSVQIAMSFGLPRPPGPDTARGQ
jgi:hypothetical protein